MKAVKSFYLPALIAIATLLGCNEAPKNTSANEELIKQYFAYFNQHQWDKMAAMYTDTATFKDPSLGKQAVKQTQQQVANKYRELAAMFPDVRDSIIKLYSSGDEHMIVEFISTGTSKEGQRLELPICTIFRIKNSKITEDLTYYNNE